MFVCLFACVFVRLFVVCLLHREGNAHIFECMTWNKKSRGLTSQRSNDNKKTIALKCKQTNTTTNLKKNDKKFNIQISDFDVLFYCVDGVHKAWQEMKISIK